MINHGMLLAGAGHYVWNKGGSSAKAAITGLPARFCPERRGYVALFEATANDTVTIIAE